MDTNGIDECISISIEEDFTEFTNDHDLKVRFIRVNVTNARVAVQEIIHIIADTSWVTQIVDESIRQSFLDCAQPTIDKITTDLENAVGEQIAASIGEHVVSVIARHVIKSRFSHKPLPLAEVIKNDVSGNPGFDFHHESDELVLIFGEAKYTAQRNAYGKAFKQIVQFIAEKKDSKELKDFDAFISQGSKDNFARSIKGYSAAFSTSKRSFDGRALISSIKGNANFQSLLEHKELIIIAVDLND